MSELLASVGVQRISAEGREFDPRIHEAISRHEDPRVEVPTVSEELQAGYLMHERLLRPAVVKVAMPVSSTSDGDNEASEP
jgi:molecular chaperone GrpE